MPSLEPFLTEIDLDGLPYNVVFGDVVYPPGGTFGPRIQGNYQLFLVQSGSVSVEVDGRSLLVKSGEMILLTPGSIEFFAFASEMKTRHSWCHFDWEVADRLSNVVEVATRKIRVSERIEHLVALGLSLHHDPRASRPALGHLAAVLFWEFVGTQYGTSSPTNHATLPFALTCVQTYIAEHYADPLTLDELTEVASITPEHLSRSFRRYVGVTPMTYLWEFRARRGVSSLRHTGLSVEEIAYQSGFKSAAHFSRKIKALYGHAPSELRKSHRSVAIRLNDLEVR